MKRYILIAGVNGAGKSTLYQTLDSLRGMPRINMDEIVKELGDWRNPQDLMRAGKIAVKKRREYFEAGISFNQETTLCGKSILAAIKHAKQLEYRIEMHYVGVATAEIAKKRIAYRVMHGGHGIPDGDVERRFVESLKQLEIVLPLCDMAVLYDNSQTFQRFAVFQKGGLDVLSEKQPEWYRKLNN